MPVLCIRHRPGNGEEDRFGPYENRPAAQRRPLPENVLSFPMDHWHSPWPPGYSAHAEAVPVVSEKARVDVLRAVEHARGCGCPTCYREANRTYGWYSGETKQLKPK